MEEIIQFMLNADQAIFSVVHQYGHWIYVILFSIIFIETGLVVVTFFPGDTLLFSAGMLAASGDLSLMILLPLLILATILGNTSNYFIGRAIGKKFFKNEIPRRNRYLNKARNYYERYKGQAVLWSRFIPFMRSFIPFVTGIAKMPFASFTFWNSLGGVIWILLYVLLGFFFGNIPWVKEHYGLIFSITLVILLLSLVVTLIKESILYFRQGRKQSQVEDS